MSARPTTEFLRLERRILVDEHGGILRRWQYGRALLRAKAGRKQLPHGMIADLIAAAERAGLKLTEREIQRRIKCATVYATEAQVRRAATDFGSWTALHESGFPAVEGDEPDLLTELAEATADDFEQLTLIPGLGPSISTGGGRRVRLDEATVADIRAHRDMYLQIHENYSKRLALIEAALAAMVDGSDGDDSANAVEAWTRGAS